MEAVNTLNTSGKNSFFFSHPIKTFFLIPFLSLRHLFLQFNFWFFDFSLKFWFCFSFTPNHLKSRLYRTNFMQTCIILFYFSSDLISILQSYLLVLPLFLSCFFESLTSTFSPFTPQSTHLISLNIHSYFHNLSPPHLSFSPLLHFSSLLLLIQGAFTPPSVMCCPWIDLKEELEAVDVDTGNTRLNTVKFTIF